jgi:hypothetical protein
MVLSDKLMKNYVLSSSDSSGVTINNFMITSVTLEITESFDEEIGVYIDGTTYFIEPNEILENEVAITKYDINLLINTERNIEFDSGASSVGSAVLTITGYSV